MTIPVVVVDDEVADRYLVKRRLTKIEEFGELIEISSGDKFLEQFFNGMPLSHIDDAPLLVLMDINMPGRDGFQTIKEVQRRVAEGQGPISIIVMMFTSSSDVRDQERADELNIIKGYISKPLDSDGISYILDIYKSETAECNI